jgi:hypothetical protein
MRGFRWISVSGRDAPTTRTVWVVLRNDGEWQSFMGSNIPLCAKAKSLGLQPNLILLQPCVNNILQNVLI